jgi:hypothetical protein
MAAPQSTALPTAPVRNEGEAEFISKSNAFVAALEPFRVELQDQADFNDTAAINAGASETSSKASEDAAKVSELLALSAGNYIGVWASLTGAVTAGQSVAHDGVYWGALVNIADVTADEPGISSDWQEITGLLEYDTNSNGEYWKYADGTLVCTYTDSTTYTTSTASGSLFVSDLVSFTFPFSFISVPKITTSGTCNGSAGFMRDITTASASGTGSLRLINTTSSNTGQMGYTARGKWK